jgi:hypothetical protein
MAEKDRGDKPQVPPPPPRQPDPSLKGYIERDNKPGDTGVQKDAPLPAR